MEQRRADSIARILEEEIFDGTHPDGTRLDEVRLAQRFGVSRTPMREALQRLSLSGLVEQKPRRGVFVRQPSPVELIEMFEVMAELEAVCGRLAALRIDEAALEELADANTRCRDAADRGDADGYYHENERFHHILYRESGNAFLADETRSLHRRLKPFRRTQLRLRGRMDQSLAEHDEILAALSRGDGAAAAEALRSHVAIQGEKFHRVLAGLKSAAE
ncbi:GntR family transcriptional regulator [Litorisediminicola beolgyonensis]|uniref:GntR family transcriptional regulator n=1 Tax=Litorisediminicola beolgyonensis TaxID=1173614 RepID=A0ABW3ZDL6_9RHOB